MMNMVVGLVQSIFSVYRAMTPYLLIGLTFAGLLHVFFKKEFIIRHLGSNTLGSVVKAALLGVPLPLCSCGVIPTALSLRRNAASKSATMSFLISTPQTGVDSIVATWGMLGPVFAVFRPLAAFAIGIFGGTVEFLTGKCRDHDEKILPAASGCGVDCVASGPWWMKGAAALRYGYGSFLDDISVQLLVGIIISGLITFFLPADFFERYIGNDVLGMLVMIVGGVPLYVCATASIPIAAALMDKGVSPGVALVFLAVGPATNAASLTIVAQTLGKRFAATYLVVMITGAVVAGFALNAVYPLFGSTTAVAHGHVHGSAQGGLNAVWVGVFSVLLMLSYLRKLFARGGGVGGAQDHADAVVRIEGMTCNQCAAHVAEALRLVAGVRRVSVRVNEGVANIWGDFAASEVDTAIRAAGYSPHPPPERVS